MRTFWAYYKGDKAGIQHEVKNLGWLLAHHAEVTKITITKSLGGSAHFTANMTNDRYYQTRFESFSIACAWLKKRGVFAHIEALIIE